MRIVLIVLCCMLCGCAKEVPAKEPIVISQEEWKDSIAVNGYGQAVSCDVTNVGDNVEISFWGNDHYIIPTNTYEKRQEETRGNNDESDWNIISTDVVE